MAESNLTRNGAGGAQYQRERSAARKSAGLCVRCKNSASPGRTLCDHHLREVKTKREKRRRRGCCIWCSARAEPGLSKCRRHIEKSKISQQSRVDVGKCRRCRAPAEPSRRHCGPCLKDRGREQREQVARCKAEGLCYSCKVPSGGKSECDRCRERSKGYRRALKIETMNAYGGCRCVCCGESRIEFLTLEHPNGDGARHRRALGNPKSIQFYRILREMGFPQDPPMVVNCYNCNFSRGAFGVCPHELERRGLQLPPTTGNQRGPRLSRDVHAQE